MFVTLNNFSPRYSDSETTFMGKLALRNRGRFYLTAAVLCLPSKEKAIERKENRMVKIFRYIYKNSTHVLLDNFDIVSSSSNESGIESIIPIISIDRSNVEA